MTICGRTPNKRRGLNKALRRQKISHKQYGALRRNAKLLGKNIFMIFVTFFITPKKLSRP